MWKRISAAVVVVIASVSGVLLWAPDSSSADTDRTIPIRATTPSRERDHAEVGDTCGVYADFPRLMLTHQQIIVRDENDTIIAVEDLEGVYEAGTFEGETQCVAELDVALPEAKFYTVHVGNSRIVTYSADQFPIDPMDTLYINFD